MHYRYSFSGSDFRNIVWFSYYDRYGLIRNTAALELETLGTLSISVNEAKGDVRSLGRRSVKGRTSAIRSVGGTMVFNIINTNPFTGLIESYLDSDKLSNPWAYTIDSETNWREQETNKDVISYLPTALPPFNLLLIGSTELDLIERHGQDENYYIGGFSSLALYGIELVSESLVVSVNNTITEVAFQFKAFDYSQLYSFSAKKMYDEAVKISEENLRKYNSYDAIEITNTMNELTRLKSPDTLVIPRTSFEVGEA